MKIAILVPFFPPEVLEGTEIATYNIASHLAKRGHVVHVITSLDTELPEESTEQGFFIHRISFGKIRFLGLPSFWLKIFLAIVKIDPNLIHSQDIIMGIPGLIASKIMRRPYLVWARGSDVYDPDTIFKYIYKIVIRNADFVIALTQNMRYLIQKNYNNREILVIPNGIDFERFNNVSRRRIYKYIIYVGGLRPEKGLTYLIEAIRIITNHDASVRLRLVGEGSEEKNIKNLVKSLGLEEFVEFKGKILNEYIPRCLADSDVFVLPSLYEGFPNVVLEAMASGLPIVATRVTGICEIITDKTNGLLVDPKNAEQIAEKVLLLLSDEELRKEIHKNNRERAAEYRWEAVISQLENIYTKMLLMDSKSSGLIFK